MCNSLDLKNEETTMYDTTKFADIFIDERDKQILSACAGGEILPLYPSEVQHLLELGFIYEYEMTGVKWHYAITPQGRLYYEFCREREKREKGEALRKSWEALRNQISVAIAAVTVLILLLQTFGVL